MDRRHKLINSPSSGALVKDESTDTTCFPLFVTQETGSNLGFKTGTNLTFNSSTGDLGATLIGGITIGDLLDKSADETIAGEYTFTDPLLIVSILPQISMQDTDAATDEGNWLFRVTGGDLVISTASDATPKTQGPQAIGFIRGTGNLFSNFQLGGPVLILEGSAAVADIATFGQYWVRDDAPNTPMFTDDTGDDYVLSQGIIKHKTADQSITSSTTLVDDNHLAGWSLEADTRYTIEGFLNYKQTGGDIKWFFQFTNASQAAGSGITFSCVDTGGNTEANHFSNFSGVFAAVTMTDGTDTGCHVSGVLRSNATTGGTLDLQWAQNSSNATATIMRDGSWIRITKLY